MESQHHTNHDWSLIFVSLVPLAQSVESCINKNGANIALMRINF